jgi:hypothetical protein
MILPRAWVWLQTSFWIDDRIYVHFGTVRDYTLEITLTQTRACADTLVSSASSLMPLLGSGFQRRAFPILWNPELSPASTTSS